MVNSLILAQSDGGDQPLSPLAILLCCAVAFALTFFVLAALWKIFTKAGQPGWAAIIPIFNFFVLLKIVGRPWWWLLLMLIPIVNFILGIVVHYDLARSFGRGVGTTLGLIFLPVIFIPILGFGSAQYRGPATAET